MISGPPDSDRRKKRRRLFTSILVASALFIVCAFVVIQRMGVFHGRFLGKFGPVQARQLRGEDFAECRPVFWDLETNRLLQVPAPLRVEEEENLFNCLSQEALAKRPELRQWVDDSGVDLALTRANQSWWIMGLDTGRIDLGIDGDGPSFDALEPSFLLRRYPPWKEVRTYALRVVTNQIKAGSPSQLWLGTNQGTIGVLQWDGLPDDSNGLSVRYKMLGTKVESAVPKQDPKGPS